MSKKKNVMTGIADLLPEGLDESILTKIADLLSTKINEEVKSQIGDLTNKVTSFIRGNIEKLKEHAIKELELENDTFRNAQLFETVKSMFSVELSPEDEVNGMNVLASIGESQEQKINILVKEVEKLITENSQIKRAAKVLTDQNKILNESLTKLNESSAAEKGRNQTKRMSDSAIVVSDQNFKIRETKKEDIKKMATNGNEWLNEGVLNASKKLIRG